MKICSTMGSDTVASAREAAAWIARYRPSYVGIDDADGIGIEIDYEADDEEEDILLRIVAALEEE